MAPSTSNLKRLLKCQSKRQWLEMFDGQGKLVLIVTHFIIKLCSEDDEIIILLNSLEDSAELGWIYSRRNEEDRKFSILFWTFIAELKAFFKVPNFNTANPNELVAAFIDLLLEILEEILHLQPYFVHGSVKEFILAVKKELKFLVVFLGDMPSQLTELETTKNVLTDIEAMANDVGSFLYSFFLSKDRISIAAMNNSLSDLLRDVKVVKNSIEEHCVRVANIWPSRMTPKTAVVSLSFVDSILDYIEGLVHRNDDKIVDVKNQIITINQNLMNLKNGIEELDIERHQEQEEFSMQLIDVAYEVEYIINSFAPVSYITLRLLQVTEKIINMRIQLQELKEIGAGIVEDDGMVEDAEYSRKHISLHYPVGDEYLVGLEDAEIDIISRLLRGPSTLQVISITGMPGVGKTTLAKKLYDRLDVRYYFDMMAWCVVSQTDPRRNMLIDILRSTSTCNRETVLNMGDDDLAEEFYKCLKGRRYIIVMDDLQNVNEWDGIKNLFSDDNRGSRILFTSRNMDVAMMASYSIYNYPLRSLTKDECWDLLQLKVFNEKRCPPEFVDVGKKIARYCDGLPLAVVVIASVLKTLQKKRSLWLEVAEKINSNISRETNESMNILEQSYNYLPMHLKPCFLYLGVFEKGREIPVQKLIMLWHAEGFIGKVKHRRSEDVAQEYLMVLINRSLLLVAKRKSDGGIKSCTIHGAIHDMCSRLAEKDNFVKAITDLKHLKVLNLSTIDLSLYNLTGSEAFACLRFLEVSSIPSSMEIFKNLEFLFVDNKEVIEIPVILLNMVKLRHVHFSGGAEFSESWRQATHDESFQISNLQNLSSIFINDENDNKILRFFPHLRKLKCKYTVFCDSSKSCYPALNGFTSLRSLDISFRPSYESDDISPKLISLPWSLRKLTLRNFDLSWRHMRIIGKLPKLEVLKLRDVTIVETEWHTKELDFSELKYLKLDAVQFRLWNTCGEDFQSLERLVLRSCQLLKEIPLSFGNSPALKRIEVRGCTKSVEDSAMQIMKEQRDMGNEELKVIISSF